MKPGTIVELPDGRVGTVVYNGLIGYGIVWGRVAVNVEAILGSCPLFDGDASPEVPEPEALLRDHWNNAPYECVGKAFKIIDGGKTEEA